jgi:DNA invertase Pin-like site-specific DNA recombinase
MTNHFLGLARVSSREQQREGFSLEVQEEALHRYAESQHGIIVKLFRIAETASKSEERKTFRELIAYARDHADELDGLLFFKVDRAARNLFDYVELERLESEHGLPAIFVSQPTENTPAGRMMRRTLANMAAFYTEQQSLDVQDGIARRVQNGLFPNRPPYGYQTRRVDGRAIVEVDPVTSRKVVRIFELFARDGHTLDSLVEQLAREGLAYSDATHRYPRSKLHDILRDRSYIGEVKFRGEWYPGSHTPLIDRQTFERVQHRLGEHVYRSHGLLFAGELMHCAHCGHPITGERKTKKTKTGPRDYIYYRCARYNRSNHPRIRLREYQLDHQVLQLFDRITLDEDTRQWFRKVLKARRQDNQQKSEQHTAELQRQLDSLRQQQDRLLNMRLTDQVDEQAFNTKQQELQQRINQARSQLDSARGGGQPDQQAEKLFELSQTLHNKWVNADQPTKRRLLEIICLNCRLHDVSLDVTMRKPFDVLAEGLQSEKCRGGRI